MFGSNDCRSRFVSCIVRRMGVLWENKDLPDGTIMTTSRMMMPTMRHMRIFMSFHHICFRTRFAPRRKPWADTARLSVLSCRESSRAPRSETLLILSRIIPTVLSISCRYTSAEWLGNIAQVATVWVPRRPVSGSVSMHELL